VIPLILNGVSTSKPGTGVVVVTVMILEDIVPSPARILEIPAVSPVEPTIRIHQSLVEYQDQMKDNLEKSHDQMIVHMQVQLSHSTSQDLFDL
jgi:hypothetical protein